MTIAADQQVEKPRRKFRFRLSTLLLVSMLFFVVVGWLVERRHLQREHETEKERVAAVNSNFGSAVFVTAIYGNLDSESPERLEQLRRHHLLVVIYFLYMTEECEGENQQGLSLIHAKNALDLLQCSDMEQLRSIVPEAGFTLPFEQPWLDPGHEYYDGLGDFISRAIQQP